MKRINPLWLVVVVLAVAGVAGAIMVARRPGAKAPSPDQPQIAAPAGETKEQLAARREHMEITQKSMARAAEAPAAVKAAEQNAAGPSGTAAKAAEPVPNSANARPGRAAAAPQPAPKAAGPKPAPRKQLDALDKMGEDLAGQLK